jgi:hypothetical protein
MFEYLFYKDTVFRPAGGQFIALFSFAGEATGLGK